jgi:hypothetical protein
MTTPRSKDSSYTEGRIELAIQAFKKGQFQSLQAAALTYDAPITTVRHRARGIRSRRDSQPSNRKLSSTGETLIQWILSMDQRGMPPTTASVRRSADLLAQRSAKVGYEKEESSKTVVHG